MADSPDRLGLALAGGGFRAALFHLGVLHRLAELDVLRHVQVLSTVSGGSIIGAVYALRLKRWIEERGAQLTRLDYKHIVHEVDEILCHGIRKNLRTRLILNPIRTLRILLTHESMGTAMAKLYERHLFENALLLKPGARLDSIPQADRQRLRPRLREALQLEELKIQPPDLDISKGIGVFNVRQQQAQPLTPPPDRQADPWDRPRPSMLTSLTLNATTLNSGGRFSFSAVEVGDWYLGHFRREELPDLERRRWLLFEVQEDAIRRALEGGDELHRDEANGATWTPTDRQLALALWWRTKDEKEPYRPNPYWRSLFLTPDECREIRATKKLKFDCRFPGNLVDIDLGLLRQAKISAWYIRVGSQDGRTGSWDIKTHKRRFRAALEDIDGAVADTLEHYLSDAALSDACAYVYELYLLRTAENLSPHFDEDWNRLTIGAAVGASACFPPVFPPFKLLGIYDDAVVTRLGLTDGGAYDNTGVTALLDEGCTSVIASDTGGVFTMERASPAGHVGLMLRAPEILMRALGGVQRLGLRERRRVTRGLDEAVEKLPAGASGEKALEALLQMRAHRELQDLAYFKIDSPPPAPRNDVRAPPPLGIDAHKLAELRTDLDGFGDIEIDALVDHGYDMADRFARRYLDVYRRDWWKNIPLTRPRKAILPGAADDTTKGRIEKVIDAGRSRFFRALMVWAPLSVAVVAATIVALVAAGLLGVSLADLWSRAGTAVAWLWSPVRWLLSALPDWLAATLAAIPVLIPRHVVPWLWHRLGDPWTVPALAVLVGLFYLVRYALQRLGPDDSGRARRFVWGRTLWKNTSGYLGNVLWLVWALPLFIALACTTIAGLGWVLFFKPWERVAALPEPTTLETDGGGR